MKLAKNYMLQNTPLNSLQTYRDQYTFYKSLLKPETVFTVATSDYVLATRGHKIDQGASKFLIRIENGRIVFIPNLNCFDPIMDAELIVLNETPPTIMGWDKLRDEELNESEKYTALGLLNCRYKRCTLSSNDLSVSAYECESFQEMAKRGLYVVENGARYCTWLAADLFLFKTVEERNDLQSWELVTQDLIQDVVVICKNKLPLADDTAHSAILKTDKDHYTIRYFGFDFYQAEIHAKKFTSIEDRLNFLFRTILKPIVSLEFRRCGGSQGFYPKLESKCVTLAKTRIGP